MNCPRCGEANSLVTTDQTPSNYELCRRCSGYFEKAVVCRKCGANWCAACYQKTVAEGKAPPGQAKPPKLGRGMGDEPFSI